MEYVGINGRYILADQPMKAGGEGSIHTVNGKVDLVAKIYHAGCITSELEEKITYMKKNPPDQSILDQIAWPLDILRDGSNRFVGFTMHKLAIDTDLKKIYSYPPSISMTYEQKVIVARNICHVIAEIHKAGYVFGDFNPLNIGVNLKNGHVAFLDTDSYHIFDSVSKKTYRCAVCLDGYVAPELIQHCKGLDYLSAPLPTFTQETDRFALAIHIFKLLMNGYTPFNGIKENESVSQSSPGTGNLAVERDNYCFKPGNKPQSPATPDMSSLSPDIQFLFKKTFVGGVNEPDKRATAEEWGDALKEYAENLVQCSKNPNHYYYSTNNKCPYCEADNRYQQSLAGAQSSYHTGSSGSGRGQVSFSNPVSIPPVSGINNPYVGGVNYRQATTANQPQQKQKMTFGRLMKWILFLPFMLVGVIRRSNLPKIMKWIVGYFAFSLGCYPYLMIFGALALNAANNSSGGSSSTSGKQGYESTKLPDMGPYLYTENNSGYSIAVNAEKISELVGKVEIPEEYNGKPVTAIVEEGFRDCNLITELVVPDSIQTIGKGAFRGCTSMNDISVPFLGGSATAMEYEAVFGYIFGYERREGNNKVPSPLSGRTYQYKDEVGYAGDYSYYDYFYYIPDSVKCVTITAQTRIPSGAFRNCSNLEKIRYDVKSQDYIAIGDYAFSGCINLKFEGEDGGLLDISNTVSHIGEYAYEGCENITEIIIPDTVEKIEVGAFKGCNKLKKITLPYVGMSFVSEEEETTFGYIFGYESKERTGEIPTSLSGKTYQYTYRGRYGSYYDYFFYIPETINEVIISNQTTLPKNAFYNCNMLEKVTLPRGCEIGEDAFKGCAAEVIQ